MGIPSRLEKAETFRRLIRAKERVRVIGWLTWDQEHAAHLGKYRRTLWEVHPIHQIKCGAEISGCWRRTTDSAGLLQLRSLDLFQCGRTSPRFRFHSGRPVCGSLLQEPTLTCYEPSFISNLRMLIVLVSAFMSIFHVTGCRRISCSSPHTLGKLAAANITSVVWLCVMRRILPLLISTQQ